MKVDILAFGPHPDDVELFSGGTLRRMLIESMTYQGLYASIKDYIQPVLITTAVALPLFAARSLETRTKILVGAVYFVLNILVPPPGLSNAERKEIGEAFSAMAATYIGKEEVDGVPGIQNMFFVGRDSFIIAGAMSTQWDRAGELLPVFRQMIFSVPGMAGVSIQPGIFQRSFGKGRSIDLDIKGNPMLRTSQ